MVVTALGCDVGETRVLVLGLYLVSVWPSLALVSY